MFFRNPVAQADINEIILSLVTLLSTRCSLSSVTAGADTDVGVSVSIPEVDIILACCSVLLATISQPVSTSTSTPVRIYSGHCVF
jgi:hypothetical protein